MTPFEQQVAAVLTKIMSEWGNRDGTIEKRILIECPGLLAPRVAAAIEAAKSAASSQHARQFPDHPIITQNEDVQAAALAALRGES